MAKPGCRRHRPTGRARSLRRSQAQVRHNDGSKRHADAPALINEARRLDETIGENPVAAVRVPLPKTRRVGELDLADWWCRTVLLTPIRRDLHRVILFTGARRRSLVLAGRTDVDLDANVLLLRHMKANGPMLLPLSRFLADLLSRRLREDEPIASQWQWPSATSRSGHLEEPKERKRGLPAPHEYRHHYRTLAIAAGVPYAESALLLGQRLPGASAFASFSSASRR